MEATFNASASLDNHRDFPEGAEFMWSVGDLDGTVVHRGMEANHQFDEVGTYNVTLTVADAAGNEDTDTLLVTVLDNEPPSISEVDLGQMDEDTMYTLNLKPFASDNDHAFYSTGTAYWTLTDPLDNIHYLEGLEAVFSFPTPGTWHAVVVVADAAGNENTTEFDIFIDDVTAPVAAATEHPDGADEDTEVTWNSAASTDNHPDFPEGATFTWTWEPLLATSVEVETFEGPVLTTTFDTPGRYRVTLTATDATDNSGTWEEIIEVHDTTPPVVDVGEDLTVNEDVLVTFHVTVTDAHPLFPTGAETYRWSITASNGTAWELLGSRPTFTFLQPGVYTVTAYVADAAGNEGSDFLNVTVSDTTPPGVIEDLIVDDKGVGEVTLEWSPSSDSDIAGFRVYRKQAGDPEWEMVATLGPTETVYTDDNVEPGEKYRYRVEAFDTSDNVAPPVDQGHETEEPARSGVFPWWVIIIAFLIGLAIAMAVEESRMRRQKGREEDELPDDEETLEAVDIEGEDVDVVAEDAPEGLEEVSGIEATSLEGIAELDHKADMSEWEEDEKPEE